MTVMLKIREHIRITGDVQGVGFRYRARHAASYLNLTGWVFNAWDGSVEMEVQGTENAIDRMLGMIENGRFIHFDRVERRKIACRSDETAFEIKYD